MTKTLEQNKNGGKHLCWFVLSNSLKQLPAEHVSWCVSLYFQWLHLNWKERLELATRCFIMTRHSRLLSHQRGAVCGANLLAYLSLVEFKSQPHKFGTIFLNINQKQMISSTIWLEINALWIWLKSYPPPQKNESRILWIVKKKGFLELKINFVES